MGGLVLEQRVLGSLHRLFHRGVTGCRSGELQWILIWGGETISFCYHISRYYFLVTLHVRIIILTASKLVVLTTSTHNIVLAIHASCQRGMNRCIHCCNCNWLLA